MRRKTALLIVMLLAGNPGVSLACELWCNTPAAETHRGAVGCHRTPGAASAGERVAAATAECHDAPAVIAFLSESRQPDTRSVPMFSAVQDTPAKLAHRDLVGEGWFVFNRQPSRPPTFPTILRI